MSWIVDTLRRLANWIEARRKPEQDLSMLATKEEVQLMDQRIAKLVLELKAEIHTLRNNVENVSLYSGLKRPIQTATRRP